MDKIISKINFFQCSNFIFDAEISGGAKFVYLYLCRCSDKNEKAFPSLANIGLKCDMSKNTVIKYLNELIEKCFIIKEVRSNGNARTSNLYTLRPPVSGSKSEQGVVQNLNEGSSKSEQRVVQKLNGGGSFSEHGVAQKLNRGGSNIEHEQYPRNKTQTNNTKLTIPSSTREGEPLIAFEQFWNLYPLKKNASEKSLTEQAWQNLNPTHDLVTKIIDGLNQQIRIWKDSGEFARDNGRWIPKPINWLNNRKWEEVKYLADSHQNLAKGSGENASNTSKYGFKPRNALDDYAHIE